MTKQMDEMKREKFEKYVEIQKSGVTNMCAVNVVVELSDGVLTREDCLDIMKNYSEYETRLVDVKTDEQLAKLF